MRGDFLRRTHIGLDYFDASINRVAAWVIGTRNMLKALLKALLEPTGRLRELEAAADYTGAPGAAGGDQDPPVGRRLGSVLRDRRRPAGRQWLDEVTAYREPVLTTRLDTSICGSR